MSRAFLLPWDSRYLGIFFGLNEQPSLNFGAMVDDLCRMRISAYLVGEVEERGAGLVSVFHGHDIPYKSVNWNL